MDNGQGADRQTDRRADRGQTSGQTDKHDGHDIRLSGKSKRKKKIWNWNWSWSWNCNADDDDRRKWDLPDLGWGHGLKGGRGDLGEMVSVRVNGFLIAGGRFKSRQCNLCFAFFGVLCLLFYCFCFCFQLFFIRA